MDKIHTIAISVQNYNIKFKKFSVNNVNFIVFKGTIHALVGQSGSGKSVILKSIIGAIPNSNYKGKIIVNNYLAGSAKSKLSLGFSLNLENFPQGLSAYNFLKFLGISNAINEEQVFNNLENLLKEFKLWKHRNKPLNSFSSGMKNRIMIIQALVHNPELIILDEPGANLDFKSRQYFYKLLEKLKKQGKTIFLTTHMIDEIKEIVDDCTIINLGKIFYTGAISQLHIGKTFILKTNNNGLIISYLRIYNYSYHVNENNDEILIKLNNFENLYLLNKMLWTNKILVYYFHEKEIDLGNVDIV